MLAQTNKDRDNLERSLKDYEWRLDSESQVGHHIRPKSTSKGKKMVIGHLIDIKVSSTFYNF